jgi:hypothetical protein
MAVYLLLVMILSQCFISAEGKRCMYVHGPRQVRTAFCVQSESGLTDLPTIAEKGLAMIVADGKS